MDPTVCSITVKTGIHLFSSLLSLIQGDDSIVDNVSTKVKSRTTQEYLDSNVSSSQPSYLPSLTPAAVLSHFSLVSRTITTTHLKLCPVTLWESLVVQFCTLSTKVPFVQRTCRELSTHYLD